MAQGHQEQAQAGQHIQVDNDIGYHQVEVICFSYDDFVKGLIFRSYSLLKHRGRLWVQTGILMIDDSSNTEPLIIDPSLYAFQSYIAGGCEEADPIQYLIEPFLCQSTDFFR